MKKLLQTLIEIEATETEISDLANFEQFLLTQSETVPRIGEITLRQLEAARLGYVKAEVLP